MLKAILFDLDDTLLGNSIDAFLAAYFQAIARYVADLFPPDHFVAELMRGAQAMETNDGSGPTNEEAFAATFYPALGSEQATLEPVLQRFYTEAYPRLRAMTRQRPEARSLMAWAFEQNLQVAIATDPLFPRLAIEQRLDWAGVPVTDFSYALVTAYETMHATKARPAYYEEILTRLRRRADECLMVGDDWERDVEPASAAGIPVYWVAQPDRVPPRHDVHLAGQGTLADLCAWIQATHRH